MGRDSHNLAPSALLLMLCSTMPPIGGCAMRPDTAPVRADPEQFGQFLLRLDAQARLYHRATGEWPSSGWSLTREYSAAVGTYPPGLRPGGVRFYPQKDGQLVIGICPN